jgi:hypothetical protein
MRRLFPAILSLILSVTAVAADWVNVVSRTDVSDILALDDEIWISYRGGGVVRYDFPTGSYETFTIAEGLGHNYATGLAADDGYVYVATRNGLSKYDRADGTLEHIIRMWGYAYNDCTGVAADERNVWLSTLEGARRFDKEFGEPIESAITWESSRPLSRQLDDGWTPYVNPGQTLLDDVYSVNLGRRLVYWGGYDKILVFDPVSGLWQTLYVASHGYRFVRKIIERGDSVEIYTSGGVGVVHPVSGIVKPFHRRLAGVDVNDGLHFAGYHYVAAADGLCVRRDDGEPFVFPVGTGLGWESEKDAKKRRPSPLWRVTEPFGGASVNCLEPFGETVLVGTTDGVFVFDPTSGDARPLPISKGLAGPAVYTVLDGGDHLWAATNGGLSLVDVDGFSVRNYKNPEGRDWDGLRDLTYIDGKVFGAAEPGAVLFDPLRETWRTFNLTENGFGGSGVCCAVFDGRPFLGTAAGLLELDGELKLVRRYTAADGLPSSDVVDLSSDDGGLYVATRYGGLAKLNGDGTIIYADVANGLSSPQLLSVTAAEGIVYVGTYDQGMDVLTSELEVMGHITRADGVSHTDVRAAAVNGGYLWAAVRDVGINAIDLDGEGEVKRYYARYGLGDEHCRGITPLAPVGGRTRLAFATAGGVSILEYDGEPPDFTVGDPDAGYK